MGGDSNLPQDVERPRLQLLRDACAKQDGFFLALHQTYCIWSLSSPDAHALFLVKPDIVDAAFGILEQTLKRNDSVTRDTLTWFSRFPSPVGGLLSLSEYYTGAVAAVGHFFELLTPNWIPLVRASLTRQYPYLMDEMIVILGCLSPVLQTIFFTSSRRRLGVADGPLGIAMESLFREDQKAHWTPNGPVASFAPNMFFSSEELERRNLALVTQYRHLVQQSSLAQGGLTNSVPKPSNGSRPRPHGTENVSTPPGVPIASQASPSPVAPPYVLSSHRNGTASGPVVRGPGVQDTTAEAQAQAQAWTRFQHEQAMEGLRQQHQLHTQLAGVQRPFQPPGPRPRHQHTSPPLPAQHQPHQPPPRQHGQAWPVPSPNPVPVPQVSPRMNGGAVPMGGPSVGNWTAVQRHAVSHAPSPQGMTFSATIPVAASLPQQAQQPLRMAAAQVPVQQQSLPVRRYVPSKGSQLSRSEWAYDTGDKKSVIMALHQAHLRSPRRVMRGAQAPGAQAERHYQAVKRLALGPLAVPSSPISYSFSFVVGQEEMGLLSKKQVPPLGLLPISEYFNGSLRYRVRCSVPGHAIKGGLATETQWVTSDTSWPDNIFMTLNNKTLSVRRQPHNGKDLPAEITDFLRAGENKLEVVVPPNPRSGTLPAHYLAVEVVETLSHSVVMKRVLGHGAIRAEETVDRIKSRLMGFTGKGEDEGVSVQQKELSIDLADPFSATIFSIPARGATCLHMECFDLETWLNTRPSKATPACHHKAACRCASPEPSTADKWKCPICSEDARPYSLRIDGFLQAVRGELEAQGKQGTKSLLVAADGTWQPVVETDDGTGSDGEDTARHRKTKKTVRPVPAQEVIELLDDE